MRDAIRKLRDKTGAGIIACKEALEEAGGDIEKAIEILRKKGVVSASKKIGRVAKEGVVESYIHMGGKIGVMVELNCETDFVARNEEFKRFAKDIAMQVAAAKPSFVKKEEIPQNVIDKETEIIKAQIASGKDAKKPKAAVDKIIEGKLGKFYEESCLLEQPFIKEPTMKVKDLLTDMIAKMGENIVIKRFSRFQLGEEI